MKQKHRILWLIALSTSLTREIFCNPESYWKTFIPWSAKKTEKTTETFTVPFNHPTCTITVSNTTGSITVKSWQKETATVEIQKKAPTQEAIKKISVEKIEKKDSLSLTTHAAPDTSYSVDYVILVPAHANLQLSTKEGNIECLGHFSGKISAKTEKGSIEIDQSTQLVVASAEKAGTITIMQADGPINAYSASGAINIKHSKNSVVARTGAGSIAINAHALPTTSKIDAKTESGSLSINLDQNINADIQASTQKGTVISSIPITLKSHTTTLGPDTWSRFKKQVDGAIGSGESLIRLCCTKGSIKIAPIKM